MPHIDDELMTHPRSLQRTSVLMDATQLSDSSFFLFVLLCSNDPLKDACDPKAGCMLSHVPLSEA